MAQPPNYPHHNNNNPAQQPDQPPYYKNMAQQPGQAPNYNNMSQQPSQPGQALNNYGVIQQPGQPPLYIPMDYQLQPPPPPPLHPPFNPVSNPVTDFNVDGNNFTLSACANSDGDASRWPVNDPSYNRGDAADTARFCADMSTAYSKPDFYTDPRTGRQYSLRDITFTDLPQGYALFWKSRPQNADETAPTPARDTCVFGHPRGIIKSAEQFAKHVHAMLGHDLKNCQCEKCSPG